MNVVMIFYGTLFAFIILGSGLLVGVYASEENHKTAIFWIVVTIFLSAFSFAFFYNEGQEHIIEKKICPVCREKYDQTESFCSKDGEELVFVVPEVQEEKE